MVNLIEQARSAYRRRSASTGSAIRHPTERGLPAGGSNRTRSAGHSAVRLCETVRAAGSEKRSALIPNGSWPRTAWRSSSARAWRASAILGHSTDGGNHTLQGFFVGSA